MPADIRLHPSSIALAAQLNPETYRRMVELYEGKLAEAYARVRDLERQNEIICENSDAEKVVAIISETMADRLAALFTAPEDIRVDISRTGYRCFGCKHVTFREDACCGTGFERLIVPEFTTLDFALADFALLTPQEWGALFAAYASGSKPVVTRCTCGELVSECSCVEVRG